MKMMFIIPGLLLCQSGEFKSSVHAPLFSVGEPLARPKSILPDKKFPANFSSTLRTFINSDSSITALPKTVAIASPDSMSKVMIKTETELLATYTAVIDQHGKVTLEWQTNFEKNVSFFVIEKSTNGRKYNQHGFLKATGNGTTKTAYRFIDLHPEKGINYYRLKEIKKNLFVKNIGVQTIYLEEKMETAAAQNNQQGNNLVAQISVADNKANINTTAVQVAASRQ